jgi:hypothetical protein
MFGPLIYIALGKGDLESTAEAGPRETVSSPNAPQSRGSLGAIAEHGPVHMDREDPAKGPPQSEPASPSSRPADGVGWGFPSAMVKEG